MKKMLSIGAVCAAMVCFWAVAGVSAVDAPADGLKMEKTKKPVVFNHSTHTSADCQTCHHTWDGAAPIKSCAAAGCHDNFDKKDKSVHSYFKATHNRRAKEVPSCVSCHKKTAGKDRDLKKKLTGCRKSVCHP